MRFAVHESLRSLEFWTPGLQFALVLASVKLIRCSHRWTVDTGRGEALGHLQPVGPLAQRSRGSEFYCSQVLSALEFGIIIRSRLRQLNNETIRPN